MIAGQYVSTPLLPLTLPHPSPVSFQQAPKSTFLRTRTTATHDTGRARQTPSSPTAGSTPPRTITPPRSSHSRTAPRTA